MQERQGIDRLLLREIEVPMSKRMTKNDVAAFWESEPCGTRDVPEQEGEREYFEHISRRRYQLEPFIRDYAKFPSWAGCRVLEVGTGVGTDHTEFLQAGATAVGTDLTRRSLQLTADRLRLCGLSSRLLQADAEQLPFDDGSFDLVYSWGVIHHTTDTVAAAREIVRVCRPGGEVCVMLYHRRSIVSLQTWIIYALLRGQPWKSLRTVLSEHMESPGTKAYTKSEARDLFLSLRDLQVNTILTPYDMRMSRERFLPKWMYKIVPHDLGWFIVVRGTKSA